MPNAHLEPSTLFGTDLPLQRKGESRPSPDGAPPFPQKPRHTRTSPKAAPAALAPTAPGAGLENELVYLSVTQVAQRYGVSRATVWRWTASIAAFPAPLKLGGGATRWLLSELIAYEHQQLQQRAAKRGARS